MASQRTAAGHMAWQADRPKWTREREFFIDNLLVRIHRCFWWTVLAPWELEFPFPGSLISTFLESGPLSASSRSRATPQLQGRCVLPCKCSRKSYTLHALHPAARTLHPAPCTLHRTPHTLYPAPCTLHLTPCTLHPAPCTLHLAPKKTTQNQSH